MKKSNKILISSMIAGMTIQMVATPLSAFAAETTPVSNVQTEKQKQTSSYDSVFRIPNSSITKIENNAGNYGGSVIKNAIDDNPATHWETNKPNNATFNNKVTVTFNDLYEVASLNYQVRQDAGPKGFPLEYNIYYSTTETGNDFQLLKHGTYKSSTASKISIEFEPTEVRRIQFEFVKANNDWASMAEIAFYKEDVVAKQMDEIFTDKTCSALSDAYKDAAKIEEIKSAILVHPNKDQYLSLIEDAQTLLVNPDAFSEKVFTASQRGNRNMEQVRTKTNFSMWSYDTTGYYISPGETIQVYVEADPNGPMPSIAMMRNGIARGGRPQFYSLKPGLNLITAPDSSKVDPASICINNDSAYPEDQAYAPRVRIVGGTKFPRFVLGETTTAEFKQELEEYLTNVSYSQQNFVDGNPNGYNYNMAEIVSENTIISTSAAGALKEVNNIISSGSSVEEKMEVWEDMYFSYAKYSGFDLEDETSSNYRPRGKFISIVFENVPFGYAAGGHTGYAGNGSEKRDGGFYTSLISAPSNGGWAVPHEWGHVYENSLIGRGESTNNLFSLMMQDKHLPNNRMVQENRWEAHFTNYHNTKQYPKDQLFYGAIVYQLEPMFGGDIYGRAAKIARENPGNILAGLKTNNDRLAVCLSIAAETDLTDHFDYYGETVSAEAKAKVADLPKTNLKTYYANNKSFTKDASAFTKPSQKPVVNASGSGQITINVSMDEPDNAILCYEIYRDGEFLGVTYNSKFIDKTCEENTNYEYSAIAYDRKLNPSPMSDSVIKSSSEPIIQVKDNVSVAVHSEFNPLDYVKAYDVAGNDITDQIEIIKNNVNTDQKGSYEVTFTVADAKGNTTTNTCSVEVVSTITYLSDIQQQSAKVGWGSFQKDKSPDGAAIELYDDGYSQGYKKGIGAHANSEVIYNVEGKGYHYFEANVGISQTMKGNTNSSAKFEVWVDGVKQFDSGMMKWNTNQQFVKVDITDAKEVKLITNDCKTVTNKGDQTIWAGARFIKLDSAPVISNAKDVSYQPGDEIDFDALANQIEASDPEDGDISVTYVTDYKAGGVGNYTISYSATDSDGNTTTKDVNLNVVNAFDYASDIKWVSASTQWGTIHKDASLTGGILSAVENGEKVTYAKGLGTHAYSEIVYDLSGKNYGFFTSKVAINADTANNISSVSFQVYVDGVLAQQTPIMRKGDVNEIKVNITGAKKIKLVVTDGGNGNGNDHANWLDAKFQYAQGQIDRTALFTAIKKADTITNKGYTTDSWSAFETAKKQADELYKNYSASQAELDAATAQINSSIDDLKLQINRTELEQVIAFAQQMKDITYVKESLTHRDTRWYNFVMIRDEELLPMLNGEYTQQQIDEMVSYMTYMIEETGQTYAANTNPIQFVKVDRTDLQNALDYAKQITDISFVNPSFTHREERLYNITYFCEDAIALLTGEHKQQDIDSYTKFLIYTIQETGQAYTANSNPTPFY